MTLAPSLVERIADCTEPEVLTALGLRPDDLAHHDRTVTQAIARRLHDLEAPPGPLAGFRWWSALTGAWHATVVFTDRERDGEVTFGPPRPVERAEPALLRALSVLGIPVR